MKRVLGSFGAVLLVALGAAFLFTRRRHQAEQAKSPKPVTEQMPDPAHIADEMREAFVPGKTNTGRPSPALLDLNSCSVQDLLAIPGIETDWAERIIDSRPYRNKMDLLSRMVVPIDIFHSISERVSIAKPDEAVKVA